MTTTNTHNQRQDKPRDDNNKSLSSLESVSTKPCSGYFYFSGDWSPSPQLRAFTQEYPDSLILWSLHSPRETTDQVLVCNLVQGEDKAELRKKLWPGALVRFEDPSSRLTPFRRPRTASLILPNDGRGPLVCELKLEPGMVVPKDAGGGAVVFGMGRDEPAGAITFVQLIDERLIKLEAPD